MQLGELRLPAEGPFQHLGAEARASHAEEQNVREALGLRGFANAREPVQVRELAVRDPEPAEPMRLIAAGPQRRVARPEPPHLPVCLPVGERLLYSCLELRRQYAVEAPLDARGAGPATLRLDRRQQLAECVGKQLNAVGQQRVRRRLQRDAGFGQRTNRVAGAVEVFGEARARAPVIPERREGRGRDRVDRVGSDQLLDVDHVAIAGVLRSRAGPEQPLRLRAARGQGAPTWAAEQLLITLEGEPGVGDRHFAPQRLEQRLRAGIGGFRQPGVDLGVDRRIDSADEEAGHAGDPCRIASPRDQRFEPGDVRLGNALVGILREEQRHVDVDALRDQLPDGRDALRGGRYLDHQVRTAHGGPQAPRLCERARRVGGEKGRHLQADVTVAPVRLVVHAAKQVGGVLDIPDRQLLVQRRGVDRGGARRVEEVGVIRAAGDRLLEDGGVGGHPADAVLLDQPLQLAAGDQAAPDVIEPDRLPEHLERSHRAFERGHLGEAAQVPGLAAERGVQKGVHQFARQFAADDATAEHEHVHVVVLDPLVRGIGVVAQAGADSGDAVGRHRGADAAAAQDDPAIGAVFAQCGADRRRVVCIIDGLAGMGADIEHLFVLPCEECLQCFLQLEPRVIRSNCDPHLNSPVRRPAPCPCR